MLNAVGQQLGLGAEHVRKQEAGQPVRRLGPFSDLEIESAGSLKPINQVNIVQ